MRGIFGFRTLSQKIVFSIVIVSLPMALAALYFLVNGINKEIDFADTERHGDAYQRPLEALLEDLPAFARAVAGNRDASVFGSKIASDWKELKAAHDKYGEELQFTPEGLAKRKRGHVRIASVEGEWQQFQSAAAKLAPADLIARQQHLSADIRSMISHDGDTSGLILDPDLDSYYLMDATLQAIPQTQDRVDALLSDAALGQPGELNLTQITQLAVTRALLKESDLDRIKADAQTAVNEDAGFNGVSPGLQSKIPAAVQKYAASAEALLAALDQATTTSQIDPATTLRQAALESSRASAELWKTAITELDVVLQARIDDRKQARLKAVIIMVIALVGSVLLVTVLIRRMVASLRDVIQSLRTGAEQIASASAQVASSSQSLAQGASEQAASLEETSASTQELSSMTRKNAANSSSAADLMSTVDRHVETSNQTLEQMVHSMREINSSSDKISKIIKVIDEIAFQTNILALNAAVEAARAGEAGMGFAVVAGEVRNLAQRSAQAAKDTEALIAESIAKSKEGNQKLQEVTKTIHNITESTSSVKLLVEEVNMGSQEQARGLDQISKAVSQMDQVTQSTAASAEQNASAGEQLAAQAQSQTQAVAQLSSLVGASE